MITRRKFVESAAALGTAAFLPKNLTCPPGDKCEIPSTVECYWDAPPSPERFDVILYVDPRKDEIGVRYTMKTDLVAKREEIHWWVSLEDVRQALKRGYGHGVLQSRWPSLRMESTERVLVDFMVSIGERPDRFCIYGPKFTNLFKIPDEDVRRLIRIAESA